MNCLSWWLPILVLPLPICPPELFVLFLIAYVLRTKPCVYCCLVLFGLSISTFYWSELSFLTSKMATDHPLRVWNIALPAVSGAQPAGFQLQWGWPSGGSAAG
ncbi:hypothetical protein BCV69DRAFT_310668 [Microstroma glucosiphilum]|uniref:Uncharacterized protein n=1 Tax=Pseudomicrostroma glucosiphilum TaxID=1684307 RepID=A0A316UDF3_9BASI|nr:hypothetical protein BCV69DRAFT_310668 [Pseudomicrostroma glucosiphilum]PWN23192.1 hypothetical protein BCV69DRAFT_310668 [Pseudomicrostroma glucosiphilum]